MSTEPDLTYEAVYRTARKTWRCVAADPLRGWDVTAHHERGWTGRLHRFDPTRPLEEQEAEAAAWGEAKIGQRATASGLLYERFTIEPRLNPEHRGGELAHACAGWIEPGDRYVEWRGDAAMWESGSRYCLACGTTVWAAR